MDYGSIASDIKSGVSDIKSDSSGISASNFNGFWSGSAHDNLTGKLTTAMSNLSAQLSLLSNYAGALNKLQKYKDDKEKIASNEGEINRLSKEEEPDKSKISSLESENERLKNEMKTLKSEIESVCNSISPFSTQDSVISY